MCLSLLLPGFREWGVQAEPQGALSWPVPPRPGRHWVLPSFPSPSSPPVSSGSCIPWQGRADWERRDRWAPAPRAPLHTRVCSGVLLVSSGFHGIEENPSRGGLNRREVSFVMVKVNPESRQDGANVAASQSS